MSVILTEQTNVLVQGMTGHEGQKATESMIASGIKVSAGVTPGRGGQRVFDRPVFNSVLQALAYDQTLNVSVLYVPPLVVLSAANEAMEAGIKTLIIVTENVPVKDTALILEKARECQCRVIGPSSIGILSTRFGKVGSIGKPQESQMYSRGNVGVVSKSGGMCAETSLALTLQGIGQSTVLGIGGDVLIGTNFVDALTMFEQDPDTKVVVVFGEIGGFYEHQIAEMVTNKIFTKPIVAFISGQFAEKLGRSLALGHAGAIIEGTKTTAREKKKVLREAGILVADYHHQIPELVKKCLV